MRNGRLCIGFAFIEDVGCSAIGTDCYVSSLLLVKEVILTGSVHWHIQISNWSIRAKYFFEMFYIYVLGEPFDNNLGKSVEVAQ